MHRKICDGNGDLCWSLHALWDAEILKLTYKTNNNYSLLDPEFNIHIPDYLLPKLNLNFDLKFLTLRMNHFLCIIYMCPTNLSIQAYAEFHKDLALYLINLASRNTAVILNSKTKLFSS